MDIREGDILPKFYGLSYQDPCRLVYIAHPIPINFIVRFWKYVLYDLIYPVLWTRTEKEKRLMELLQRARRSGYSNGHAEGYQRGLDDGGYHKNVKNEMRIKVLEETLDRILNLQKRGA